MQSSSRPSLHGAAAVCAVAVIAFLSFFTSCDHEKRPDLTEQQLEEVLYEYHLLEALRTTLELDTLHARLYLDDIFRRHNTSQSAFDASMAYYMRHNDQLFEIYQRLSTRIENEAMAQGADNTAFGMLTGDTANVWRGRTAQIFNQHAPYNLLQFSVPVDTAFHAGDKIMLSFATEFMFESGTRSGFALLAVTFKNDSVVTRTAYLSSSMSQTLEVSDDHRLGIKAVQGFFLQKESTQKAERNSSATRMMIVRDIRLIRMHSDPPPTDETLPADSLSPQLPEGTPLSSDSMPEAKPTLPASRPDEIIRTPIPPPEAKARD